MSRRRPICQRYLFGRCPLSDLSCLLSHNKEDAPLCRRWVAGSCIGATGNACIFRHFYTQWDAGMRRPENVVERMRTDPGTGFLEDDYSSPCRVKVVKEQTRHRREEVDLETGKRRSWVEVEEFEVFDLTGDTPAKTEKSNDSNEEDLKKSSLGSNENDLNKPTTSPSISTRKSGTGKEPEVSSAAMATSSTSDFPSLTSNPPPSNFPNSNVCPVCGKAFKGEKGVKTHRSHPKSACAVAKENTEENRPSDGMVNTSVIIIEDTPVISRRPRNSRRPLLERNL